MRIRLLFIYSLIFFFSYAQAQSLNIASIDIEQNENFEGYDLIDPNLSVYVLAEHWHNIQDVPKATMKVLRYLHQHANVRILAIEQGASAAHMVNNYLNSGDTVSLRQVVRNTMFWSQENWTFFENLRAFNLELPENERIIVKSIDIEYKMESAVFVINELIGNREVPESLSKTVGIFKKLFEDTRSHREQYQGISVMHYYDRDLVESLVHATIDEMEQKKDNYVAFFGENFVQFATIILDMDDGLTFDYTNPKNKYKFRDRLIYKKFVSLVQENPESGILCVIGLRHATKKSSIYKLKHSRSSPIFNQVGMMRISALLNKLIISSDLKRVNFNFPNQLRKHPATLIKHSAEDAALRSSKSFDYTLFINQSGTVTPFEKVYKEN